MCEIHARCGGRTVGSLTSPGISRSPKRDLGFAVLNEAVQSDAVAVLDATAATGAGPPSK